MDHLKSIERLNARRSEAFAMGGEERIEKQHAEGKLTVRERLDLLFDPGTFIEYGQLIYGKHTASDGSVKEIVTDGLVAGHGEINGRTAIVIAEDFTILGGSTSKTGLVKLRRMYELARRECVPFIMLHDGAGARAQSNQTEGEGVAIFHHFRELMELSGLVPMVSAAMGPCGGQSAIAVACSDVIVMTEGTSMLASAGPRIISQATGHEITKEELGGSYVHCSVSGVADLAVANDAEAIEAVKRYLSYLPPNAFAYPPDDKEFKAPIRPAEDLLDIVPADSSKPFDMHDLLDVIVDGGSFFELKPDYAPMLITGFARMAGQPVGIIANQPAVAAGAIVSDALEKMRKFMDICDAYHVPMIFLVDVPGALPAKEEEAKGILRRSMAAGFALGQVTTQMVSVVIRKAYGLGGSIMCGGKAGQTVALCWASADMGGLPPKSRTAISRDLEGVMDKFVANTDPLRSTNSMSIDDVIDPRETRARILAALKIGRNRRTKAPQQTVRRGIMP